MSKIDGGVFQKDYAAVAAKGCEQQNAKRINFNMGGGIIVHPVRCLIRGCPSG